MGGREGARGGNDWKVINDLNKNTLRISSYEGCEQVSPGVDKLPLDIEIFQNLVDNICRKFDPETGENLLCFGGCAIFNSDGSLKCVENFLPKYPSVLRSWLRVSPCLHSSLAGAGAEKRANSDAEVRKSLWEAVVEDKDGLDSLEDVKIDRSCPGRGEGEFYFRVTVPGRREGGVGESENGGIEPQDQEKEEKDDKEEQEVEVEDPTRVEEGRGRGGRRKSKYKMKAGLPLPPRPVLSLTQEEVQAWFPVFVERLGNKRFPTNMPRKFESWDTDVDSVLSMKGFAEAGPRVSLDWSTVSSTFCWKLKLAAAIILEKRGVDYTTFAEEVEEKHEKYSINDLKLMSMSKNPETFEKLFVKNGLKGRKKPNYLDEFERKSSEIVLQNLRLINARDKRINGNSLPRSGCKRMQKEAQSAPCPSPKEAPPPPPPPLYHQRIPSCQEVLAAKAGAPPAKPPAKPTSSSPPSRHSSSSKVRVKEEEDGEPPEEVHKLPQKMPALKPIEEDFVFLPTEETSPPSVQKPQKRKKSSDKEGTKEPKPLSQKYLCKNNFQKGDFLIHPSQLQGQYGPVKLVTFRRETKKVFLSVSEFEAVSVGEDEATLEKSSHKSRSTPAKFLDSYVRINEDVEILDKRPDKMRIRRKIPKKSEEISDEPPEASNSLNTKLEITDDDTEDSKDSAEDDSEMVIDET